MPRMPPRTPALLLLALLALPGAAVAQEAYAHAQTEVVLEGDASSNGWSTPSYELRVEPRAQRAVPGEIVTYEVLLRSRADQTIHLSVDGPAAGYRYRLAATEIHLFGGEPARTTLKVMAGEEAQPRATFLVKTTNAEGHRLAHEVYLETVRPVREPCCERPEPPQTYGPCCERPRAPWTHATFAMKAEPIETGDPGIVAYRIHVRSAIEQTIRFSARATAEDVVPLFEPSFVHLAAGEAASVLLRLQRSDGSDAPLRFSPMILVVGESDDERRELRVFPRPYLPRLEPLRISLPAIPTLVLETVAPPTATQEAVVIVDPRPAHSTDVDHPLRDADLERKIEALSLRVARLEAALRFLGLRFNAAAMGEVSSP